MKRAVNRLEIFGFGFIPEWSQHHFLVSIPVERADPIRVSEHFEWNGTCAQGSSDPSAPQLVLEQQHWDAIVDLLRASFNQRLHRDGLSSGRWQPNDNHLRGTFDKELLMLAWRIEDIDLVHIPDAIARWQRFAPEEHWWLATMTMTSKRGQGWRAALRHILTDAQETVQAYPVGVSI